MSRVTLGHCRRERSEEELKALGAKRSNLKMEPEDFFSFAYSPGVYKTNFDLPEYFVEYIRRSWHIPALDGSVYVRFNNSTRKSHQKSSRRR